MSFAVDQHLASSERFDVGTARTLFWKRVPFVYKAMDREEMRETFTVRILSGVTKHNHNLRVLRMHISTESDYLFLHSLEVTEEDFQRLKEEQGILVDFANFPEKLITLLERCMQSSDDAFQAELTTCGGDSCLRIVETNDFNKLPHVSLQFRPGSDESVKSFLAFRLAEVTEQTHSLQSQLTQSQAMCDELREEMGEQENNLKMLREKYETGRLEANAEQKRIRLEVEERLTAEKENLRAHIEKEKSEKEGKWASQIETLMERHQELESENQRFRDDKYLLDKQCAEFRHCLATAEGKISHLDQFCEEMKDINAQLTAEKQQLSVDLSQARAEVRSLSEKVSSVENVTELQRNRISDLEASKLHLEKLCEELKSTSLSHAKSENVQGHELRDAKFVIQRLTRDLHLAKEKQCNLRAILSRQEDAVAHQARQLKEAQEENSSLHQHVQALNGENSSVRSEMEDTVKKLKESAEELKENESMIVWLHTQINEATANRGKPFSRPAPFHGPAPFGPHSVYSLPKSTPPT